jgi:hypothetical protein
VSAAPEIDVERWTTWAVQLRMVAGNWTQPFAWTFESKMAALKTMQGAKRNGQTTRLVRVLHEVVS